MADKKGSSPSSLRKNTAYEEYILQLTAHRPEDDDDLRPLSGNRSTNVLSTAPTGYVEQEIAEEPMNNAAVSTAVPLVAEPVYLLPECQQVSVVDTETTASKLKFLKSFIDEDEIDEHNEKFVPGTRQCVVSRFDQWVTALSSSRVFVMVGNAGIGKSAMMSWLVRNRSDLVRAYHFCQHDRSDTQDPKRIIMSLVYQLCQTLPSDYSSHVVRQIEEHDLTRDRLLQTSSEFSVAAIFKMLLKNPLNAMTEPPPRASHQGYTSSSKSTSGQAVVLLIDALDEVSHHKSELLSCLERHLDKLPAWLKLCVSTRSEAPMLNRSKPTISRVDGAQISIEGPLKKFRPVVVEPSQPENDRDLCVYFMKELRNLMGPNDSTLASALDLEEASHVLTRKSGGYFIYADCAVDRLRSVAIESNSSLTMMDLEMLPDGMESFYREQMMRLCPDENDENFENSPVWNILQFVVVAMEPLPVNLLKEFTGCGIGELKRLSKFLPIRNNRIETYHKSFVDWLVNPGRNDQDYYVDEQQARNAIAKSCVKFLEKRRNLGAVSSLLALVANDATQSEDSSMYYLLKYTMKHVLQSSRETQRLLQSPISAAALDMEVMLARAAIGDSEQSDDCISLGQFYGDRVLHLVGRSLRLSAGIVAQDYKNIPAQLIGRLLGPAGSPDTSSRIREDLQKLLSDWKYKQYGYPWWCPVTPSWDQADSPCQRVLRGRGLGNIQSVSWSPDGRNVASCYDDATSVLIWDVNTGQCQRELECQSENANPQLFVSYMAWSPDGRRIATCTFDSIQIWNADLEECKAVLYAHSTFSLSTVSWSPDGRQIVSGGDSVRVWNSQTGMCEQELGIQSLSVRLVVWSPCGNFVASVDSEAVRLWDTKTWQCSRTEGDHDAFVQSLAWSHDGKYLLLRSADHLQVLDIKTGQGDKALRGHVSFITSIAWSPDSRHVASGSEDCTVRIWDVESGQCLQVLKGHSGFVKSVSWSSDGRHIASGSEDTTVRIWDAASGDCRTLSGHTRWILSVSWSPDGKHLATSSVDKSIRIWDTEPRSSFTTYRGGNHSNVVVSAAWSPDGLQVVSGSRDTTIRIWSSVTGECQKLLDDHRSTVNSVSWSPDGTMIASGSSDETIRIWVATTGECRAKASHFDVVEATSFSPDSLLVASASRDKTLRIWNSLSGTAHSVLEHSHGVSSMAWSPDGTQITSGSSDGSVRIWNISSCQCISVMNGHTNTIASLAWSPDGKTVASGSYDRLVALWNAETGQLGWVLEGHPRHVTKVAWSSDGSSVASQDWSGQVCIWDRGTSQCTLKSSASIVGFPPLVFQQVGIAELDYTRFPSAGQERLDVWGTRAFDSEGIFLVFFELMGAIRQ